MGFSSTAVVWYVWGGIAAVAYLAAVVLLYLLVWFNTKRVAARNAVYAALTYRQLAAGQQRAVDECAAKICERVGVRVASLGRAFPMSGSDKEGFVDAAGVYALRSLAMHELGIAPAGSLVPRWYELRNPFVASMAGMQVRYFRKKVEREFGVSLNELDA